MARSLKPALVVERRQALGTTQAPSHRLYLPRPLMIGATLLFWAAVVFGLRLLAS